MRKVILADSASASLRDAEAWLTQTGAGRRGQNRWLSLLRAFERLANAPYTGASSQRHPGLRDLVVANYRLFYTVDPDTGDVATAGDILIVAIIGPGQLPPPL